MDVVILVVCISSRLKYDSNLWCTVSVLVVLFPPDPLTETCLVVVKWTRPEPFSFIFKADILFVYYQMIIIQIVLSKINIELLSFF